MYNKFSATCLNRRPTENVNEALLIHHFSLKSRLIISYVVIVLYYLVSIFFFFLTSQKTGIEKTKMRELSKTCQVKQKAGFLKSLVKK